MRETVLRCHLIVSVLTADGVLGPEERAFMERSMDRLGLTPDERNQVLNFVGAEKALEAAASLSAEAKTQALDEVVHASLVDGRLSPHEMHMVKAIGRALGISDKEG